MIREALREPWLSNSALATALEAALAAALCTEQEGGHRNSSIWISWGSRSVVFDRRTAWAVANSER
jgi:hypothetical protein